jgi:adenylate cyclase
VKLSLSQLFACSLAAAALVAAIAFGLFRRTAHEAALATAQSGHDVVATHMHQAVVAELGRARHGIDHFESGVRASAIRTDNEATVESYLLLELLGDVHLSEVTLTRAKITSFNDEGAANIASDGPREQVSVLRERDGRITTRVTKRGEDGAFAAFQRAQEGAPLAPIGPAMDPTEHLTFSVITEKRNKGRAIWSDLHFAEPDQLLPEARRRVVLTVQKAIEDAHGFLGVLRIGLSLDALDALSRSVLDEKDDPETVAIFAFSTGDPPHPDLVARLDPADAIKLIGQDLRVVPARPPPALTALEASPLFAKLDPDLPVGGGMLDVGGERYLATMRALETDEGGTTGWFVVVLGPEAHYTREARRLERHLAFGFGATILVLLAIGALTVRGIRRGLGRLAGATQRMHAFDFRATSESSRIREIDELGSGLERAKTVVRAMGKYIPLELVRRLFATNEEPQLGGQLSEISMLFTDIEGFTTLAEKLPPNELALRLGEYLEAMTRAIVACDGTIDKYIGDAVMAIWNAPLPVDKQAEKVCRAILAAQKAAGGCFASAGWKGLPPLVTRFGAHKAKVMVGHFGAPSRLSYTALGDGVNLAARLEPLCKQYGIVALVSEDIQAEANTAFVFRRIDRVAVKGKTKGIDVYELLGATGDDIPNLEQARTYEKAFDAYLAGTFAHAAFLLEPQAADDPPSQVLLDRCRYLERNPPAEPFTGVYVAKSK